MSKRLPEVGQSIAIMIGMRRVTGVCTSNECHTDFADPQNGLAKGDVVPGLGLMLGDDGHEYWVEAGRWAARDV